MIEVKNIKHKYGERSVLKGVDLKIKRGELTILMGVNGCGKSTVLSSICGDIQNNSGNITIDGTNVNDMDIAKMASLRSVYRQAQTMSFHYTAYEIVENGRYIYEKTVSKDENEKIIKKVMTDMDVWKFRNQSYSTLSGGEKSRVQFARVLAQSINDNPNKQFILLDEPNSALDVKYSIGLMKKAKALAEKGYGVFMILHDINLAFQYGDVIYLMDKGKIESVGTNKNTINKKVLAKVYDISVDLIKEKNKRSFVFE